MARVRGPADAAEPSEASFNKDRFMDALGASFADKSIAKAQSLWGGNAHVRDLIDKKTPQDLLNAFEAADPERLKPLVDIARADPALAKALHNAIVKDPTVLNGLEEMAAGGGEGIFDPDLVKQLNNPTLGPVLRGTVTNALNKIAEDPDVGFEHMQNLLEKGKAMAKIQEMFELMKTDPDAFITNLLEDLPDGELKEMLAGVMSMVMPLMQDFTNPNGFMLGQTTEFARVHGNKLEREGEIVLRNGATPEIEGREHASAETETPPGVEEREVAGGVDLWGGTEGTSMDAGGSEMAFLSPEARSAGAGVLSGQVFTPNASGDRTDGYKAPAEEVEYTHNKTFGNNAGMSLTT